MSEERLLAVQVDSYPPDRRAPEVRTAPLRMIDGFLEILAYTRLLLEGGPSGAKGFPEVAERVQLLLDRAEAFRARQGFPVAEWRQALYAVCAWVDEQILCSAWDGRNPWLSSQLQRKYFDTSRAGELFFERLQALPEDADQVREVFDYCLSLGFQGRYFEPGDQARLERIRQAQLDQLPRNLRSGPEEDLFPEVGQSLPGELSNRKIPYRYLTYAALAAIPPLVFLILYSSFTAFLDDLLQPLLK
jgi:type VI secretion system protein ImpK